MNLNLKLTSSYFDGQLVWDTQMETQLHQLHMFSLHVTL